MWWGMERLFTFDFKLICMSRPVGESWYEDTFSGLSWGDRAISWCGLKMKCPSGTCRNAISNIYSGKLTIYIYSKCTYQKSTKRIFTRSNNRMWNLWTKGGLPFFIFYCFYLFVYLFIFLVLKVTQFHLQFLTLTKKNFMKCSKCDSESQDVLCS